MSIEKITREKIISEISKMAFCDEESNIKSADKLRALSLLNTILKDDSKKNEDIFLEKLFIDDL